MAYLGSAVIRADIVGRQDQGFELFQSLLHGLVAFFSTTTTTTTACSRSGRGTVDPFFAEQGAELGNFVLVLLDQSLRVDQLLALGSEKDLLETRGEREGR